MQNLSALVHSQDVTTLQTRGRMAVPKSLYGRRDPAHLGDSKCIYHFTPVTHSIERGTLCS